MLIIIEIFCLQLSLVSKPCVIIKIDKFICYQLQKKCKPRNVSHVTVSPDFEQKLYHSSSACHKGKYGASF